MDESMSPVERVQLSDPAEPRVRAGQTGRIIYIEDSIKHVPNKYLAVNVAAQRARQLNERALPVGEAAKQARKPTTQALLELIEGRLRYEVVRAAPNLLDETGLWDDEDEDVAALFDAYGEAGDASIDADFLEIADTDDGS